MKKEELVSIIVPVYNVELYLNKCIESILGQTYKNIELLLINDGSTDSSYEICQKWSRIDGRVKILCQENQGQGIARNLGVKKAKGRWIAFVDSDDWVDPRYIEMMMNAIISENADMVKCNYTQFRVKSNGIKTTNFYQTIGIKREDKYILAEASGAIWNLIIKRTIITDNGIEQPACKGQDVAVGLSFCLLAKKIVYVNEALYFYRKERNGATTEGGASKRSELALEALPWLVNDLRKNNIYMDNKEVIRKYIAHNLTLTLWGGWLNLDHKSYVELRNLYYDTYRNLVGLENKVIATWGSWNLTETAKKMIYVQDMDYAFNLSSIISVMHKCEQKVCFSHNNIYRRKMIGKDIYSSLWDTLEERTPDIFIIDFIEERNDLINNDHGYMTRSSALIQTDIGGDSATILEFGSEVWFEEWKRAFTDFSRKLMQYIPMEKIILVKNFLTERHGNIYDNVEYENIEEIRKINNILNECYQYAIDNWDKCKVIDFSQDRKYITDDKYEYGIEPYYINSYINEKVGEKILETL